MAKWVIPATGIRDLTLDLRFDAAAERLVRTRYNGEVQVLKTSTGEILTSLPATPGSPTYRAAFAGTTGCIATIESRGRVCLIDPTGGRTIASRETPCKLSSLAVSPDLRTIAVAGGDRAVYLLDADTLEIKNHFFTHDDWISALAFHPDKPLLASGSADHSIKIRDYTTGRLRQTFLGLEGSPLHLAFSPTGHLLAVEGMESALNILSVHEDAK